MNTEALFTKDFEKKQIELKSKYSAAVLKKAAENYVNSLKPEYRSAEKIIPELLKGYESCLFAYSHTKDRNYRKNCFAWVERVVLIDIAADNNIIH